MVSSKEMPKHRPNLFKHKVTVIRASKRGRYRRENVLLKDILSSESKKIEQPPQESVQTSASSASDFTSTTPPLTQPVYENSRKYAAKKHKECHSWAEKRSLFESAFFESNAFSSSCCICGATEGDQVLCQDCGPEVVRCIDCTMTYHAESNLLHKPDLILDGILRPFPLQPCLQRKDHCCGSRSRKTLQIFDEKGRIHNVWVLMCTCEPESVTLIRLKLWPASPDQPRVAFHFELMSLLHFLLLEGRLSTKAACQALRWKNGLLPLEVNLLYHNLVSESFEEYRYFRFRCYNLNAALDEDIGCPACPKENGDVFLSLDGNFGLVRKKSSGVSYMDAKHKALLFAPQEEVDQFVNSYHDKTVSHDCSNFQAGDVLRAKNKTKKLDTTGVFGVACRHGVPVCFLNLRHGERLAYAAFVIDHLLAKTSSTVKLHVIYDIACMLAAHFKKQPGTTHEGLDLALPVFHAYGHKMACQVAYSTRWRPGYGLTDGEVMERLWSYLRKFSSITKEMTPAHREDLLTDALLHYSRNKRADIGLSLVALMERAVRVQEDAAKALQEICNDCSVSLKDVGQWRESERCQLEIARPSSKGQTPWQEKYVKKLLHYEQRQQLLVLCEDDSRARVLAGQCQELDQELKRIEQRHSFQRWGKEEPAFKVHLATLKEKQQVALIQKMWTLAVEYSFFLDMSKKYSEGQAVAVRLSKQIRNSSKALRKLAEEYNNGDFLAPSSLEYRDVTDLNSGLYTKLTVLKQSHPLIPSATKRKAVDLLNLADRSKEEIDLLKKEMTQTLHSAATQHQSLVSLLTELKPDESERGRGLKILLGKAILAKENGYSSLAQNFAKYVGAKEIEYFFHSVTSSGADHASPDDSMLDMSVIPESSSDESDDDIDV